MKDTFVILVHTSVGALGLQLLIQSLIDNYKGVVLDVYTKSSEISESTPNVSECAGTLDSWVCFIYLEV